MTTGGRIGYQENVQQENEKAATSMDHVLKTVTCPCLRGSKSKVMKV